MKRKLTLTGILLIGALVCGTLFGAGPCLANPPAHFCGGCVINANRLQSVADRFCKDYFGLPCAWARTIWDFIGAPYYSAGTCVKDYFIVCVHCGEYDCELLSRSIAFTGDECGWDY